MYRNRPVAKPVDLVHYLDDVGTVAFFVRENAQPVRPEDRGISTMPADRQVALAGCDVRIVDGIRGNRLAYRNEGNQDLVQASVLSRSFNNFSINSTALRMTL